MTKTGSTEYTYLPFSAYFSRFLVLSGISLIILFLIIGIVQRVFESGLRERMLISHERGLDMAEQLFDRELLRAVQDTHLLSELQEVRGYLLSGATHKDTARLALENTLAAFADSYGYYDQVRLLSLDGMELIRINYDDAEAVAVSTVDLQDKSDRAYVERGRQLKPGQVYISPLELNIEHGQIEVPHQPVIRIVERIETGNANEDALLVLNYKANFLLNYFRTLFRNDERGMLLNAEGYWLSNHARENEWGWLVNNDHLTLATEMPLLWQSIIENDDGEYTQGDLTYSHRRIEPAGANQQILDGRYGIDLGVMPETNNTSWYVVIQTDFSSRLDGTFFRSWAGYLLISLLIAACLIQAFLVSRYRATRSHFIRELRDLYDNAPIGYLTIDADGYIKRVNRALTGLVGFNKNEMLEKMQLTDLLSDPNSIKLINDESIDQTPNKIRNKRLHIKHKDGHLIPAVCSLTPRFSGSGALILSRCSVQDFSEQAEMEDALKKQARTDPLTGVYNRRYFREIATRELSNTSMKPSPVSVLLIDIDHFKQINDAYGHSEGDVALISITKSCAEKLRKTDILARFGGEEFVALMPGATQAEAQQKAEEIREYIANTNIHLSNGTSIQITVSIGVAAMSERDISQLDALLNLADTRLYRAKNAGRNQVCAE